MAHAPFNLHSLFQVILLNLELLIYDKVSGYLWKLMIAQVNHIVNTVL